MSAHPYDSRSVHGNARSTTITTGSTTACNGDASLTEHGIPVLEVLDMTAVDQPTQRPLWGGTSTLPRDVACCPRCAGHIHYVDTLADTLTEQTRVWFCEECAATGTIALTMTLRTVRPFTPAPTRAIEHRQSRVRAAA